MDLANNNIMELMTVNMTCDHQLIQDVRCNTLEICRIKSTNGGGSRAEEEGGLTLLLLLVVDGTNES